MVEKDGEVYHTAKSAAAYLGITRFLFYSNVKEYLPSCPLSGRRRRFYKQSDLESFRDSEVAA